MNNNYIARNQEICKLYESGMSVAVLKDKFSISHCRIYSILHCGGVELRRPSYAQRNYSNRKIDNEILTSLVAEGYSYEKIAEYFSCCRSAVYERINRLGLQRIKPVKANEIEQMKGLRSEGLSNAQVALRVGRSYGAVRNHIGNQPAEITKNSCRYGQKIRALNAQRKLSAKLAMKRKLEEEARIEAERRAAEEAAREAARIAEEERRNIEENLREIFTTCSLPVSEEFHLDSAEQGYSLLEKLHEMTAAHAVA